MSLLSTQPSRNSEFAGRFSGLATLARDYLNLSWDFEYDSPEDAVHAFASQRDDELVSCIAGLEAMLSELPDEATRDRELDAMGWGFAPRPGRLDAFLAWARDALKLSIPSEAAAG